MSGFTPEEIARGLRAQGVPEHLIARQQGRTVAVVPSREAVHLRLPWSALVSDNEHYAPALRKGKPVIILTERYREVKGIIASRARDLMAGRPPITTPLTLHARVYVPNNHRRDSVNFGKCAQDAMGGIVYADDSLLHDVRWTRAGVDVDAPRAEITLTPLVDAA